MLFNIQSWNIQAILIITSEKILKFPKANSPLLISLRAEVSKILLFIWGMDLEDLLLCTSLSLIPTWKKEMLSSGKSGEWELESKISILI